MEGMTARIVEATSSELLVITYELAIDSIDNAIDALKSENEKQFKRYTNKAQSFVRELMNTLDMSYKISHELMPLYLFVNKTIIKAYMKKDEQPLKDAKRILNTLLDGWKDAGEKCKGERPLMENTQKLVVGLTYKKGLLNESMLNNGVNRGYKA